MKSFVIATFDCLRQSGQGRALCPYSVSRLRDVNKELCRRTKHKKPPKKPNRIPSCQKTWQILVGNLLELVSSPVIHRLNNGTTGLNTKPKTGRKKSKSITASFQQSVSIVKPLAVCSHTSIRQRSRFENSKATRRTRARVVATVQRVQRQ